MWIYILPSMFTLGTYYYCERKRVFEKKNGEVRLVTVFSILIFMAMFRVNIGVDYGGYVDQYNNIINGYPTHTEIGFITVVKIISKVYNSPKVMFAIFSFFTLVNFMVGLYKQSKRLTLSVFLFIAMGYYNLTYNSIRYYFALSLVFLSYYYLQKKNYKVFVLMVIFAACFHKTSLIAIPFAILLRKKGKGKYFFLIAVGILMVLLRTSIRNIAFQIYPSYLNTVYDGGSASVFNILKGIFVCMLWMVFKKDIPDESNKEQQVFLFRYNLLALLLYTFCSWIPELSRIGYYFNITSIVFIPNIIDELNNKNNKRILTGLIIVLFSAYLVLMLHQSYSEAIHLLPYQNWLLQ